jgi:hypothetical protein
MSVFVFLYFVRGMWECGMRGCKIKKIRFSFWWQIGNRDLK